MRELEQMMIDSGLREYARELQLEMRHSGKKQIRNEKSHLVASPSSVRKSDRIKNKQHQTDIDSITKDSQEQNCSSIVNVCQDDIELTIKIELEDISDSNETHDKDQNIGELSVETGFQLLIVGSKFKQAQKSLAVAA